MSMTLGGVLGLARSAKGWSLSAVAGPAEISPAYLQKLESDEVASPSPRVLYRLAGQLDIEYALLMRLADYVVPSADGSEAARAGSIDIALSSDDLTADEQRAVAAFIALLRKSRAED